MPKTAVADIIIPTEFERYAIERTAELASFGQCGIVEMSPQFDELAAGGGRGEETGSLAGIGSETGGSGDSSEIGAEARGSEGAALGADFGSAEQMAVYAKAPSIGVLQPDVCMLGGLSEARRTRIRICNGGDGGS